MTRKRASRVGPGMTDGRRRRAWTRALLDNRSFRLDQIARLRTELGPGDRSARAEVSRAVLAGAQLSLQATQDALDRLAAGTFGICAGCDQPIELQLLDALPMTERCSTCLGRSDRQHRARPSRSLLPATGPLEVGDLMTRP